MRDPHCDLCPLSANATTICMDGSGPNDAQIMIVGEAPGFTEDRQGVPFVGRAGQVLNEMLEQAGFRREDVFVTNSVRCRPPENREPAAKELEACRRYLIDEIGAVRPRVIVALGNSALKTLTGKSGVSKYRGEQLEVSPKIFKALKERGL